MLNVYLTFDGKDENKSTKVPWIEVKNVTVPLENNNEKANSTTVPIKISHILIYFFKLKVTLSGINIEKTF